MPNRVIRDGLLDSEAILTCPTEARWLFLTICLQADDIGFFEATPFKLARKADLDVKLTGKLLLLLAEEDLIRPYEVEKKQYGFIPRFQQRVKIIKLRYPLPPRCVYEDDADALNKINNLASKMAAGQPPDGSRMAAGRRLEVEDEDEDVLHPSTKDVVDDASAPPTKTRKKAQTLGQYVVPDCPYSEVVALYHEHLPMLRRVDIISEQRKRHLQARWRAVCADIKGDKAAGLDWFSWFFKRVAESKFLTGKVASRDADKAPFTAHFDWLMTPEKFIRVCEGFYNR